jgi:hypothetical protein
MCMSPVVSSQEIIYPCLCGSMGVLISLVIKMILLNTSGLFRTFSKTNGICGAHYQYEPNPCVVCGRTVH